MSDTPTETPADTREAPKPTPPAAKEPAAEVRLPDDHPLVTALATLKAENKDLKAAAEAGKTDAEKVADRLAEVEKRAAEAEARATRRDIALEHKLSAEDAALLDSLTDETAMKALAARLAGESDKKRNLVPREGNNPRPTEDPRRNMLREMGLQKG